MRQKMINDDEEKKIPGGFHFISFLLNIFCSSRERFMLCDYLKWAAILSVVKGKKVIGGTFGRTRTNANVFGIPGKGINKS